MKVVILAFLLISNSYSYSQSTAELSIIYGKPRNISTSDWPEPIAKDETAIYCILNEKEGLSLKHGISIFKYNYNLDLIGENELKFIKANNDNNVECFIEFNNQMLVVYSEPSEKKNGISFFIQSIDKKTLTLNNNPLKILDVLHDLDDNENDYAFTYSISLDQSCIVFSCNSFYKETNEIENLSFSVFDNKLNSLWKETLPKLESKFYIIRRFNQIAISNNATVYLLTSEISSNYGKSTKYEFNEINISVSLNLSNPNYHFVISRFEMDGENLSQNITIPEKSIQSLFIQPMPNLNLLCAGHFSNQDQVSVRGNFSYVLSEDNLTDIVVKEIKEFDKSYLTYGKTEPEAKDFYTKFNTNLEFDPYNYSLYNFILKPDSSFILIAEQTLEAYSSKYGVSTFINKDLNITYFDKFGKIEKNIKIPKLQITTKFCKHLGKFTASFFNNELNILYNNFTKFDNREYFTLNEDATRVEFVSINKNYIISEENIPIFSVIHSSIDFSNAFWIDSKTCFFHGRDYYSSEALNEIIKQNIKPVTFIFK